MMPSLTTWSLIGMFISTQFNLFGIVQTNQVNRCVCTTTLSNTPSTTTPSEIFTKTSATYTSSSTIPKISSTTSGKTTTKTIRSTTSTIPSTTSSTTTSTNTSSTTTPTTTTSITSTIPSTASSTTTPTTTTSITSTTPSSTSSTTTQTTTTSTTSTTPSSTSSTKTPTTTTSTTSTTPSSTSSTTTQTTTTSTTSTTPSSTSSTKTPTTTTSTTSTTPSSTSSTKTPTTTTSTTSTTPSSTSSTKTPTTTTSTTSTTPSSTSSTKTPTTTTSTTSTTPSSTSSTKTPTTTTSTTSTTPSSTSSTKTPTTTTSTTSTTPSSTSSTKTPTTTTSTTSTTPSSTSSTKTPTTTNPSAGRKRRAVSAMSPDFSLGFLGPDGTCICSSSSEPVSSTTPKHGPAKVLRLDTVPVKVPLVVSINTAFIPELADKSSGLYKKYKSEFKSKLESTYRSMENFLRIDVIGFRDGSTVCDYAVILQPGSVLEKTTIQDTTDSLDNVKIFNETMESKNKSIVQEFSALYQKNPCISVDCGYGYECISATYAVVTCEHKCSSWNKCKNDGLCLLDDRHDLPFCRCKTDDQYTYSGDYCEIKSEKFALSKTYIIAIGAGCGGGFLLILVVIIIVLLVKRKSKGNKKHSDDNGSFTKSVSMDDLRLDRGNDSRSSNGFVYRPRVHAPENQYQSGLPDTKYVQGREHKVMKNSRGEETYIYQPSSHTHPVSRSRGGSVYSSHSAGPSVYDYIDTESKFEIQRPNIRLGHMNKY